MVVSTLTSLGIAASTARSVAVAGGAASRRPSIAEVCSSNDEPRLRWVAADFPPGGAYSSKKGCTLSSYLSRARARASSLGRGGSWCLNVSGSYGRGPDFRAWGGAAAGKPSRQLQHEEENEAAAAEEQEEAEQQEEGQG